MPANAHFAHVANPGDWIVRDLAGRSTSILIARDGMQSGPSTKYGEAEKRPT